MTVKSQQKTPTAFVRRSVARSHTYSVPAFAGITAKLNQNECPFDLPHEIKEELAAEFVEEPWNRYPDEFDARLRETIGKSVGWDPAGVLLGNGSNELAQFLGFTLIEEGTPVVLVDPMFSLFKKIVEIHAGRLFSVDCRDDLTFDPDRIIHTAQRGDSHLTIVATPNNPTGRSIAFEDLSRIADGVPGILLIDEAYHEFVDGPTAVELLEMHPNVIVLRTLSKTVGLAGLRLGYLLADPGFTNEILKARLPFMINRLTSVVAEYLIKNPSIVKKRVAVLKAGRKTLYEALNSLDDVNVVPSDANFLIFKTPHPSEVLVRQLADRGVLVRDVSGYKVLERYVRANVGLAPENKAFLSALKDVLSPTSTQ